MELTFKEFTEKDIHPMTIIMTDAFNEDSMMHRGVKDGPPGYNDGLFLKKYAMNPDTDAYLQILMYIAEELVCKFGNR